MHRDARRPRPPGTRARILRAAVPAAAALLVAACTGSADEPEPTGPEPTAQTPAFCSGALPGPAVVGLLGPGRIRESGVPQVPEPGQLSSQCALGNGERTLTLATAAAESTGRVTLQGIANNTPATAVPIAAGATGLVDPGFAWLARPCTDGRTLLASLRLQATTDTPPAAAGQQPVLAGLLLGAAARAATAAGCDRGSTPAAAALPPPPTPAPVAGAACAAPAAAVTAVTGPVAGWTATAPTAPPTALARACDLTGPGDARIRFVVSRGIVAANAGRLSRGGESPVAGLPGALAGPADARLDGTCQNTPIAYRLHLNDLPTPADDDRVGALFAALVRAAAGTAGCPLPDPGR